MSFSDAVVALEQLSCILSMIGSSLVALTWAFPVENRQKHGRVLLLWLSVADFVSSLVYFIQTLDFHQNENFCKAMAVLGIFFPVASFLWTDFIAFYLYQAVVNRSNQMEWKYLLRIFHCIAWGLSALIIIFVAAFDHAGSASADHDDDVVKSNTGGWCWIKGSSSSERFYWELIGGKVVEWTSCLIVLPYLYISVMIKLKNIDRNAATIPALRTTSVFRNGNNNNNNNGINGTANRLKSDVNVDVDSSFTTTTGPVPGGRFAGGAAGRGGVNSPLLQPSVSDFSTSGQRSGADTATSANDSTADTKVVVRAPYQLSQSMRQPSDGDVSSYSEGTGGGAKTDSYLSDTNRPQYACEDDLGVDRYSSQVSAGDMHLQSMGAYTAETSGSPVRQGSSVMASTVAPRYPVETSGGSHANSSGNRKRWWFTFPLLRTLRLLDAGEPLSNGHGGGGGGAGGGAGGFFTKFYVKLSALPLVFLFLRLWGSIRVIVDAAHYHNDPVNRFLAIMQAFFDPSQGFFNAILFVFLSREDRDNLFLSLAMLSNAIAAYIPCCGILSNWCGKPLQVMKRGGGRRTSGGLTARLNNTVANRDKDALLASGDQSYGASSFGGLGLSDDDEDFECDESNRISDFSFESRLDSISQY